MDKARKITGLTEKISVDRLTSLMDHFDLHVNPNIFSKTEFVSHRDPNYPEWSNIVDTSAKMEDGKTYTVSWCSKTDGDNKKMRIRIFNEDTNLTIPTQSAGIEFPITSVKQSYTFTIPKGLTGYYIYFYGSAGYEDQDKDVTFYNCKLEVGDLATPITTVGGGN